VLGCVLFLVEAATKTIEAHKGSRTTCRSSRRIRGRKVSRSVLCTCSRCRRLSRMTVRRHASSAVDKKAQLVRNLQRRHGRPFRMARRIHGDLEWRRRHEVHITNSTLERSCWRGSACDKESAIIEHTRSVQGVRVRLTDVVFHGHGCTREKKPTVKGKRCRTVKQDPRKVTH
jgi:hypothetical protein